MGIAFARCHRRAFRHSRRPWHRPVKKTQGTLFFHSNSQRNLLEIWIEHGANEKLKLEIGEKLKLILNMHNDTLTFYFKNHDSSLKVHLTFRTCRCLEELKNSPLKTLLWRLPIWLLRFNQKITISIKLIRKKNNFNYINFDDSFSFILTRFLFKFLLF